MYVYFSSQKIVFESTTCILFWVLTFQLPESRSLWVVRTLVKTSVSCAPGIMGFKNSQTLNQDDLTCVFWWIFIFSAFSSGCLTMYLVLLLLKRCISLCVFTGYRYCYWTWSDATVALYNKSLEVISYVCFEHVQCIQLIQKRLQTSAKPSIQYLDPIELWAY